jgi:hypothetical protein
MECTPLFCAAPEEKVQGKAKKVTVTVPSASPSAPVSTSPSPPSSPLARAQVDDVNEYLVSSLAARRRLAPLPETPPDDPQAWAEAQSAQLLPKAVTEIAYQLEYGDSKARFEAANSVLDMNGLRRKESMGGGGQTIILNITGKLPWEKDKDDAKDSARIVDGTATRALPDGGDGQPG